MTCRLVSDQFRTLWRGWDLGLVRARRHALSSNQHRLWETLRARIDKAISTNPLRRRLETVRRFNTPSSEKRKHLALKVSGRVLSQVKEENLIM